MGAVKAPRLPVREVAVCGWKAVAALFERHPEAVRRLFFDAGTAPRTGDFTRRLARDRRVYRLVEREELERIGGTVHHGGIVAVRELAGPERLTQVAVDSWIQQGGPLLVLDRIGNANNLGALVRTAAFFGLRRILVRDDPGQALPGAAVYRVAEGGMEWVTFFTARDLPGALKALGEGFEVVGAALDGEPLAAAGREGEPRVRGVALVLGNEEDGLSREVAAACARRVTIPGSGAVESLNVSAAGAVLMHALFGLRPPMPHRRPGRRAPPDIRR
ncbi:MAG: RNA methyltransferase [Puniceicoccaceae bacterium]|nr:MAG: RNA methyltransferase [Puniceicoccaceae bacterium]